tara:strand:- start:671 stop:796 length:126 start_codon:yes stop_codon:yes gene_type:complete
MIYDIALQGMQRQFFDPSIIFNHPFVAPHTLWWGCSVAVPA